MSRIQETIADTLAAEVESRTEWDEPPALYTLYVEGERCRLVQFPVPEMLWASAAPPVVLASIVDAWTGESSLLQSVAPVGLYGAAFRCETWVIDGGTARTEQRRQALADAEARRISTRPDRIEARSIWGVDRAGITYNAVQQRGDTGARRSIAYPKPGHHGFGGTVPNALDRLVTAFLGVSLPARHEVGYDS